MRHILSIYTFCLGAVIGSFLNVVIWRVPRGESIVSPPSHCPKCQARIKWWQNIPLVSYIVLRGRCANCKKPISPRYFLVEALTGALFLAVLHQYGIVYAPVMWIWVSLMIIGSFIDFDLQLLPDFVTIGGMVLGVGAAAVCTLFGARGAPFPSLGWSIGGGAFGLGLLWLVRFLGSKVFRREAMGMGDVLLVGAIGALFGPVAVIFTLMASSVVGSVAGLGMVAAARVRLGRFVPIPFGPYLCLGCLAWMFFGPELVEWYLALLRP